MVFSARAATKDVARSWRRRTCTSPRSSSTLPVPVPFPLAPEVIVIQLGASVTFHAQPAATVTVTVLDPPAAAIV
jgi:hypothetical protein